MKKFALSLSVVVALGSLPSIALALDNPRHSRADNRIQNTNYKIDDVVLVRAAVGRATHIVLAPNEKVLEMVSGNSEAWEIVDRRNNIYLKPKMDNADTNLLITTDKHEYSFDLRVVNTDKAPAYRLVFRYPQDEAIKKAKVAEQQFVSDSLKQIPSITARNINTHYTMQQGKNSDSFKPIEAFDDGTFTYIKFARGKDMPNVFRMIEKGKEAIINSTVQDDYLILEGVYKTMMIRANNAVIGLYNESYVDGGTGTGTATASPVVERAIKGEQ